MQAESDDGRRSTGNHGGPIEPGTPLFRMLQLVARRVAKKLLDKTGDCRPKKCCGNGSKSPNRDGQPM